VVHLTGMTRVKPGDFADVKITASDTHDLWAVAA
jgi:hypothetical protein